MYIVSTAALNEVHHRVQPNSILPWFTSGKQKTRKTKAKGYRLSPTHKSERTKETKPHPERLSSNVQHLKMGSVLHKLQYQPHVLIYSPQTSFLFTFQFKLATRKPSLQLVPQSFVLFHHLHFPFYPFAHCTDVLQQITQELFTDNQI